jgi:GGDEF domain-containing protein
MKKLRLWTTVLIIWLIFLFNIERINSPINIRDYTYIFVAITAVVTLVLPRLRRLPYWALMLISIVAFLLFKAFWSGHLIWGKALPLTVTQISAVVLTGLISRQIHYGLREFEDVVNNITFGQVGSLPKPFSEMQGSIYREVRRARRYQRPLSVITLKIDEDSIQVALPKMIEAVQQAMMKQYVVAKITRILDDDIDDFGTITLRDDCFILVLPEKTASEAHLIAQRLENTVQEKVSIEVQTGTASLPNEAVTFEALVELAIKNVDQKIIDQQTKKQPISERPKQEIAPQGG